VKLPDGSVQLVKPPFAGRLSGFTLLFEALVLMLAPEMPFAAVARIVGISPHRVMAICRRYVALALAEADFSDVTALAIDETSRARGHDYITLAADALKRRVLSVTNGRDAKAIATIAAELVEHGCPPEQIESVSIDMSPAFIKGVGEQLPNARITNDQVPRRLACQRRGGQDAAHRAAQRQVPQRHEMVAPEGPRQPQARGCR
jgi:transposase